MQKRILIVRTDKVGDVVMITPMIREIKKAFPDSFIATLTNPNSGDVLLNNPYLDIMLEDDLSKSSFREVIRKIKKHNFTIGLLVMPTERAAYQMFLAGIKKRIGVGRKLYEVITFMKSVSRNKYISLKHEADYCMDIARALGVTTDHLNPEIFITEQENDFGKDILFRKGISETDHKIIIHTGSGSSSRNWSEEKYFELIERILEECNKSKIILTAREMSSAFKQKLRDLNANRLIFVENDIKRLRHLICITANSDLLIASSTGPLHIAAALGIKTIGLYCHRRMNCAAHWGALGDRAVNIEVSKEYCDSHCSIDKEICEFENGISIDEVIASIKK